MSKPKSKEYIESSDSDEPKTLKRSNESDSDEDEAPPPPPKAASKKSKGKTNDNPPAKRSKPNGDAGADDNDDSEVNATIGPNGERLYEFGKLRFVSVSQFKGKPYINIREYYDDHGVQKPGKKGISLPVDQWDKLKSLINQVDKDLKKVK